MNIKTAPNEFAILRIPGYEWFAWDDSTYEPGVPIGIGRTEQEAIDDLKERYETRN